MRSRAARHLCTMFGEVIIASLLMCAALTDPAALAAQSTGATPVVALRGQLKAPAGEPIAAARVRIIRVPADTVGEAVSDSQGGFVFRAPGPGAYRIAVERLGYGVWESEAFELSAESVAPILFEVPIRPVLLQTLMASGDPRCPEPRDPARLARVAERTVAALREVVATEASGLSFTGRWAQYRFTVPTPDDPPRMRYWNTDTTIVELDRPMPRHDPAALAADGYIRFTTLTAVPTYFMPSAEIIVSPQFLETHCFDTRVHADSAWIGLTFQPFRDSDNQDVRGVIWIDSISTRPERVEFEYTRIEEYVWKWEVTRYNRLNEMYKPPLKFWPASITFDDLERMGGTIEFATTATGRPFTQQWEMRWPMPLIPIEPLRAKAPERSSRNYTVHWIAGYRRHGLTSVEIMRVERNGQEEWPWRR